MSFKELNAEVFGVNSGSLKSHQNFSDKNDFNFPLLVDEEREITLAYKAEKIPEKGTQRTVYIVDRDGIIRYAKRGMPSDEELLETIRNF